MKHNRKNENGNSDNFKHEYNTMNMCTIVQEEEISSNILAISDNHDSMGDTKQHKYGKAM